MPNPTNDSIQLGCLSLLGRIGEVSESTQFGIRAARVEVGWHRIYQRRLRRRLRDEGENQGTGCSRFSHSKVARRILLMFHEPCPL